MRKRGEMSQPAPIPAAQLHLLEAMLRNESDVAYKRRVRRVMAYLDLQPGQTVLDCGTGMGFYPKVISELYPTCRLLGIDCEEGVLRYAQSHLAERGVLVVRGDIHHLGFTPESFDRVVMSEVLEHLEDDFGALCEVRRVMKPEAVLAITVPHRHYSYWYDPINRLAEGLFRGPIRRGPFAGIWANHLRLYDRKGIVDLVERAGFAAECVEELTHYCFPGTQTIVYTIGKGLIEHGLLPEFVAKSAHRFRGQDNRGSRLNPINWALALFNWIDRFNTDPDRMATKTTFVNIGIKARKV